MSNLVEQIERAHRNYRELQPVPFSDSTSPDDLYLATPDRLAYALSWVVANQIIQNRFPSASVDVLPIFHPEHGWDRFVITRRASSHIFGSLPADELGRIMISGENAPRYSRPSQRVRLPLGARLRDDPERAVGDVLTQIPERPGGVGDLRKMRRSEQAPRYPDLYAVITDLIVDYPGLVASREVYIDAESIDGQYHPLHLHSAELSSHGMTDRRGANLPVVTYIWFQLQYGEMFAFVDRRGNRAVYRTERATWARPKEMLADDPVERIRKRLMGWLRLDGAVPDEG